MKRNLIAVAVIAAVVAAVLVALVAAQVTLPPYKREYRTPKLSVALVEVMVLKKRTPPVALFTTRARFETPADCEKALPVLSRMAASEDITILEPVCKVAVEGD